MKFTSLERKKIVLEISGKKFPIISELKPNKEVQLRCLIHQCLGYNTSARLERRTSCWRTLRAFRTLTYPETLSSKVQSNRSVQT
jgi:hypothetical protein